MFLLRNPQSSTGGVVKVSGDREIHDVVIGDGPTTALLLHGLGGGHGAYPWSESFAKEFGLRLLVPWLVNHGPSTNTDNFEEAVQIMDEYRDQRGARDCLVLGHSYGGAIATALSANSGLALPMAAPINPRFIDMSWPEVAIRLGWVGLDLVRCIGTGVVDSALRLDTHRYAPAVTRTLLAGSRIDLGIRVLRSMPDLTTHIVKACAEGRPPLRLWGLADFGVQQPRRGLLPGHDWYLPWVWHADFAFQTIYPYYMVRRAAQVQLGLAEPLRFPYFTHSAA